MAGDCNSLAETHAWFDSRVAHHSLQNQRLKARQAPPGLFGIKPAPRPQKPFFLPNLSYLSGMLKLIAFLAALIGIAASAHAEELAGFRDVTLPVGPGAREPYLYAARDGRLLMSWTEGAEGAFAVKVAVLSGESWGAPRTVAAPRDLFVNWADFPSVAEFSDGTMIVHWLTRSSEADYSYDVNIALSKDDGESWSAPFAPHRDGTKAQHGFVTLAPLGEKVIAVWLDGRAYEGALIEAGASDGMMQLRSAVISSDGTVGPDIPVDFTTCSCCQTSAAVVGDEMVVAYRDRTKAEIRDISVVRMVGGRWSDPETVHQDNWEIPGCPVNGPAIASRGQDVVVAWFTGAGDIPAVKVAFSGDKGASFGNAARIDLGQPAGRVDALMLDDGTALVSWVEWPDEGEALMVCRANADGCLSTQRLTLSTQDNPINFPRIAATHESVYIAWTQPLGDGSDTIRMMRLPAAR